MKSLSRVCACALAFTVSANALHAMISRSDAEVSRQFERATSVFEGQVVAADSFVSEQGNIKTRFSVRVNQPYKGRLPIVVSITLPGGVVGNVGEAVGCQPQLKVGDARLFLLTEGTDGSLHPVAGCASAVKTDHTGFNQVLSEIQLLSLTSLEPAAAVTQSDPADLPTDAAEAGPESASSGATNLITSGGLGARFLQPDQGDPIPYLVDADALPAGMSLNDALGAVGNALAAWEERSSVRFSYQGLQSFGQSASTFPASDGALRIQLHDLYGAITGSSTLGIGGRAHWTTVLSTDWTTGGQVFGNDFHETTEGYVVLKHTKASMQNLLTFEEVLCHEVGHALSMAHSSENPSEPTHTPAYQAIMYYQAHADDRGASPTSYDSNVLNQVHPIANTPPYMFDRVMDVVTASPQPSVPGINEIELKGYDLQGTATSPDLAGATSTFGSFSDSGGILQYAPAIVGNGARSNPADNSFFDYVYGRCSDGVHSSPYVWLRVVSLSVDNHPAASDGIPNAWMVANGWDANPAIGVNHGAYDDKDGDTVTNIDEYRSWMDPNLDSSAQLISAAPDGTVSWQGKAYELYELHGSTNLNDWFFVKAVLPTNDTPSVKVDGSTYDSVVYRAFKVP